MLFSINLLNFFDRQVLATVTEPLRHEWSLSDTQIGWLITAFTLLYAVVGLPLGRLADTTRRTLLLTAGLTLWSVLTYLSGLCRSFWPLFAARMGVGVGEASCAPAASSMIGDLYEPHERARAMSIFMLGLPAGVSLSYMIGGYIAQHYGWRAVFYVAGFPGILLAFATRLLREAPRGQAEPGRIGVAQRSGNPLMLLLGIPTMRWIILSGLFHNFVMYALTFFLPALLVRYHGVSMQTAGLISAWLVGIVGVLGMLAGGWLGDTVRKRWLHGRVVLAGTAVFLAAPAGFCALWMPPGALHAFVLFQAAAAFLMYTYYPMIYATIHDIVEPALRGRAMALYFFLMYLLGASLGPVSVGWLSDHFARRASTLPATEAIRALALHHAMYLIPVMTLILGAVLCAGAYTVATDIRRLQTWIEKVGTATAKPGE